MISLNYLYYFLFNLLIFLLLLLVIIGEIIILAKSTEYFNNRFHKKVRELAVLIENIKEKWSSNKTAYIDLKKDNSSLLTEIDESRELKGAEK